MSIVFGFIITFFVGIYIFFVLPTRQVHDQIRLKSIAEFRQKQFSKLRQLQNSIRAGRYTKEEVQFMVQTYNRAIVEYEKLQAFEMITKNKTLEETCDISKFNFSRWEIE